MTINNPSISKLAPVLVFLSLVLCQSSYAIDVDGQLNEPEWQDATVIENFTTVSPYSLAEPEYATEVRILSNQDGIYIGVKNSQPLSTQTTELTARDAEITADLNEIIIDFDSSNIAAYGFQVGNGGSMVDGIWRDENNFSNDWDGSWSTKTSQDDSHWYSETHLPWNIVSMSGANSENNEREIKVYVLRYIKKLGIDYANVATSQNRQRFMSDFASMKVASFDQASFQKFAYASARQDTIKNDSSFDAGVDLFWKSGTGKQLSVTINPDFGQVESDDLVVNFSPNETFFSERRPFFTQNQALFDVRGSENLRLIHTRRIGSRPDSGPDLFSDIVGAVKFTDSNKLLNYGVFAASEADATNSQGRDYYVGRALRTTDSYDLGFTSTFTSRLDLQREASVNAVDYEYRLGKYIKFSGQALYSSISNDAKEHDDTNGGAAWFEFEQQLSENKSQSLSISRYGTDFEVNDLGFLPRANLSTVDYEYAVRKPLYPESSKIKSKLTEYSTTHKYNNSGDHLSSRFHIFQHWSFKDTSSYFWYANVYTAGNDDRITRGGNILKTKSGYEFQVTAFTKETGKFRTHAHINYMNTYDNGKGVNLHFHPSYQFSDKYSTSLGLFYIRTDDWTKWIAGNQIGSYERKQASASWNIDAQISDKQELRFKFQWIAISADASQKFSVHADGSTTAANEAPDDFSFSNTALQIRYRYELAPLSNIFLVYSRGGHTSLEDTESLNELFSQGWENKNSDNIFAKIRYQF